MSHEFRAILNPWTLILALPIAVFARGAAAKGDPADPADGAPAASGSASAGLMETGQDPSESEAVETGRFSPKGETGKMKKDKDVDRDAAAAPARKPLNLLAGVTLGFGYAPVPGPGADQHLAHSLLFGFVVGGGYDVTPEITLGLRVPWSTATFADSASGQSLGNPEVSGEYRVKLGRLTTLPIGIAFGVPVAQGDPDTHSLDTAHAKQGDVNTMADAANGYHEGELFAVKRFPITPYVGVHYERRELFFHADQKFLLLPSTGGAVKERDDAANGACCYVLSGFAMRFVTTVGAAYSVMDRKLFFGLDAWAALLLKDAVWFDSQAGAPGPGRFQLVAEPRVGMRFGPVTPTLGYMLPLGGRLGKAGMGALVAQGAFAF